MKKNALLAALALALLPLSAQARSDRDAATAGMAGSGLSGLVAPAWGAFSNASAIVFAPENFAVAAGWQNWMPRYGGGNEFSLGTAYGNDRFGYSVAFSYLAGKPYDIISASGSASGSFTPSDFDFAAGVGAKLTEHWALSATVRALSSKLAADYDYRVFGLCLLATWRQERYSVSAGLTDLGTRADGRAVLPAAAALSAAWTPAAGGVHAFLAELDAKYYLSGGFAASLGLQYAFDDMVFVRAGYRCSNGTLDLPSHAAAGLGVKIRGVELDLSCLFASPTLAGTVLAGIGCRF